MCFIRFYTNTSMERSRFPSPSKKLLRHASRNQRRRPSAEYALVTLLLVCVLIIFHSKLSAANGSSLARLFIVSAFTQRTSDFTSLKQTNDPARNAMAVKKMSERNGSRLSMQGGVEDADMDTEIGAELDSGTEEDLEDNAVKQQEEDKIVKPHLMGRGNWDGVTSKSSEHKSVLDSLPSGKFLPGSAQGVSQPIKKHGSLRKTLPRWDPFEIIRDRRETDTVERNTSIWRRPRLLTIRWDHLLGVVRKMRSIQSSSTLLQSRKAKLHFKISPLRDLHGSTFNNIQIFGSDDEPLDQYVADNLERIATIDDALLFTIEKSTNFNLRSWTDKKLRIDTYKKERSSKGSSDLLNPMNNPLLQDPDTSSPNGLNGNDRAMLKSLRKAGANVRLEAEHGNAKTMLLQKVPQEVLATERKDIETFDTSGDASRQLGNPAERSILELSRIDHFEAVEERRENTARLMSKPHSSLSTLSTPKSALDTRKWGFYPGLDSNLAFSDFLEQFLEDEKCSHRVFMVWTTPPWTYTVRYQRGLESVLHFHPQACVVVFSISIELDFFMSFVEQGFRVAVVVPNLEELLAETPTEVFSSFWLPWTKTHFFHIHYSELLRLAALYKYGGIYLDTDVVLLKPLVLLHNTIGAEKTENEALMLNGAVMAFDKNSTFLLECLVEFTETYDDQLMEFNGEELVTRVANRMADRQTLTSEAYAGDLRIEEPHVFFPFSRKDISRYFEAPRNKEERLKTAQLAESIYNHSSMLHFWNQKTQFLVPQASSLVEIILNRYCLKCDEYL